VKFAFIRDHLSDVPVEAACNVLEVTRSGYYAWLRRPMSRRDDRRRQLAARIRVVHAEHRGVYGSPRVYRVLKAQGERVSENTVAGVMRQEGVRARVKRKFVPRTTDSAHTQPVAPNTLDRVFESAAPNRKWAADITYIATDEGWLYLAGIIDLYSRRIVGWSMAEHMRAELVSEAMKMALAQRRPKGGLLHHSDRGVQYACDAYQDLLWRHGIRVSMSGKGDCWDNAVMESFWGTLKTELVNHEHYTTRDQARQSIFEYIEVFYNRKRLHSSLGYVSPEAFETGQS